MRWVNDIETLKRVLAALVVLYGIGSAGAALTYTKVARWEQVAQNAEAVPDLVEQVNELRSEVREATEATQATNAALAESNRKQQQLNDALVADRIRNTEAQAGIKGALDILIRNQGLSRE